MAIKLTIKDIRPYTDLNLGFTKHPVTNQLTVRRNLDAIKQSVKNILLTRKGEKPFDHSFGSPVYDFLFENATTATKEVLQEEVKRVLTLYEPRISVQAVIIKFSTNTLDVEIRAEVVATTEPFELNVLFNRLR